MIFSRRGGVALVLREVGFCSTCFAFIFVRFKWWSGRWRWKLTVSGTDASKDETTNIYTLQGRRSSDHCGSFMKKMNCFVCSVVWPE